MVSSGVLLHFKICPACNTKARVETRTCLRCRRAFRHVSAAAAPSPAKTGAPSAPRCVQSAVTSAVTNAITRDIPNRIAGDIAGDLTTFYCVKKSPLPPALLALLLTGVVMILASGLFLARERDACEQMTRAVGHPAAGRVWVDRATGEFGRVGSPGDRAGGQEQDLMSESDAVRAGFRASQDPFTPVSPVRYRIDQIDQID